MAAVSLAFALIMVLRAELWEALLFAVAWAMVIVSLDRMFVVSLPRTGTWQAQLFRATPRFLLALLLGLVISTPFVLQIFRPEIAHQITILHDQAAGVYFQQLKTSSLTQQINRDTTTVSNLETEAAGGGSGPMTSLLNQRSQAEAQQSSDLNKWQCQLYGTAAGGQVCNTSGNGPLAQADAQRYYADVAQVNQLNQQIQQLQANIDAGAKAQLPAARRALQAAQNEQALETNNFNSQNANNTGLLIRLQALGEAAAGNSTLDVARWLLFALFVIIDLMPVMLKVMLNLGPENNYDKMLEAEEEKQLQAAAVRRAARLSVQEAQVTAWQRVKQEELRMWEAEQLKTGSGAAPLADSPEGTIPPSEGTT